MPTPDSTTTTTTTTTTALTKRSASTALMPPPAAPPPFKRQKRPTTVLDEDTYIDGLSHIIKRDFFPGLLETDVQQEYLAAVDAGDDDWIRESGQRLMAVMTPVPGGRRRGTGFATPARATPAAAVGETPKNGAWAGDTPGAASVAGSAAAGGEEGQERKPKVNLELSLTDYQAKYTSEDNESFNALLDRQNQKKAEKYAWQRLGERIPSARRLEQERQKLLIASSSSAAPQGRVANTKDLALTRRPDAATAAATDPDTRKATVDTARDKPRNALMFTPDVIEESYQTVAQAAEAASSAPPKRTVYGNTRLPLPADPSATTSTTRPTSPTHSTIAAALGRGRPAPPPSTNAPSLPSAAGGSGAETPRVNGYAFVPERSPSPPPPPPPPADRGLLAKLGVTAAEGAQRNPFVIRPPRRREDIHYRLVDQAGKQRGGGGERSASAASTTAAGADSVKARTPATTTAVGAGTPRFASAPKSLKPAAQRLLNRVGGASPRVSGAAGAGARSPFGGGRGGGFGDAFALGKRTPRTPRTEGRGRLLATPKVRGAEMRAGAGAGAGAERG
ncbi:uncharacterized protein K452DRAFT_283198 [Aplosporella prunicola CBS 121167]|uniref:Nuclear protein DGCR14 n=1 Tax=Aplosporella prunicola CBS 121167 TaxID=1176127 RepID=A0A6A6BP83_9PEZI|nr:uncharacterized protein K452DRAFT_283198 [Aplosporella prunicola CBS 121167]KAF2145902.1 hypothetical protein K452DRAFT_283198 [Aplosporella prunicola CBS 121167]